MHLQHLRFMATKSSTNLSTIMARPRLVNVNAAAANLKQRGRTRNLSSKKEKGTPSKSNNNTTQQNLKEPKMNFDHRQGNTILHQKAKRATELHAELNALLENQAQRRADEAARPLGSGLLDFIRISKSELINIFSAFTCVVLAYQIVAIRKGAKKLIDEREEVDEKMEEIKNVLRVLGGDEFRERVLRRCQEELKRSESNGSVQNQSLNETKGWFGRVRGNSEQKNTTTGQDLEGILSETLKTELARVIGDRALSNQEIEEKKLYDLQKEMGIIRPRKGKESSSASGTTDDSFGGLGQILTEVQKEDTSNGSTVVKRNKGFI